MKNNHGLKTIARNLLVVIYILTNLFIAYFHEPWRDESQAWVIARNLGWLEIPKICASEGHPCLWFYIVKFSILSGIPFRYFSIVSIVIMSIAVFIMLEYSEFSLFSKILLILSPIFFYYNPVICRTYSVVILLICLLGAVWKTRHESPVLYGIIIAMLLQSHVLIFGIAIGCVVDMVVEIVINKARRNWKYYFGLIVPLVSFIAMISELRQSQTTETFTRVNKNTIAAFFRAENLVECIISGKLILRIKSVLKYFGLNSFDNGKLLLILSLLMALFLALGLINNREFRKKHIRDCMVCVCGLGVYWSVIIIVRPAEHIQMAILFLVIIFFLCWILRSNKENQKYEVLFSALCLLCIPKCVYGGVINDLKGNNSGSREIVSIIEENVVDNSVILLNNDMFSTSVYAYLVDSPKKLCLWDISNGEEYIIHKWGHVNLREVSIENVSLYLEEDKQSFLNMDNFYYVYSSNTVPSLDCDGSKKSIGGNQEYNHWSEYYWLYKIDME